MVVGVALAVAGIITFSSAKLFSRTERFILYFDESVTGLDVGAPVKYRGVTIGKVAELYLRFNQAVEDVHIPVLIELQLGVLEKKSDGRVVFADAVAFAEMVRRGLRGKLETESFVTGRLYVNLEIMPGADPPQFHQLAQVYKEIPTVPTQIQLLLESLAKVDLVGISQKLDSLLQKLDRGLGELQMAKINAGVTNLLFSLNRLATEPELTNTLASLHQTLEEYRALAATVRAQMDPLASGADRALGEATQTLAEMRRTLDDLQDTLAPHGALRQDLAEAIAELGSAAQSVATLADFLERNPGALLGGRKTSEPKR